MLEDHYRARKWRLERAWGVNKTDKITRYKIASSSPSSVSNDMISGSPHHHDQLCSRMWRMFYLEWSGSNEQQAEVMNVTRIAQLSDYRLKTYLHALTYQVVCSGAYVPPYLTILWGEYCITNIHIWNENRVTNEERGIKVREVRALCSEGPNMRQ